MPSPSPALRTAGKWSTVPLGLAVSAGLVWHVSYAAFAVQTTNPDNSWATGSVVLVDDRNGAAMFAATNLQPGSTDTKCIVVTSSGSLPSAVKLYGTSPASSSSDVASYLDLTVEEGLGGTKDNCTGFSPGGGAGQTYTGTLATFVSTYTDAAHGLGSFAPTGTTPESRTYRFKYTLRSTAPTTAMGKSATATFLWQASS